MRLVALFQMMFLLKKTETEIWKKKKKAINECSWVQPWGGRDGNGIGQMDSITLIQQEKSAHFMGSSKVEMNLWSCSELGEGNESLYPL